MHAEEGTRSFSIGLGSANRYRDPSPAMQETNIAKRETEVMGEMTRLSRSVEILQITASQLADRLVPVRTMRAQVGRNDPQPSPPEATLCVIADRVRAERKGVEQCIAALQAAIDELEV